MNAHDSSGDASFGGLFSGDEGESKKPAGPGVSQAPLPMPKFAQLVAATPAELEALLQSLLSGRRREDPAQTAWGHLHEDGSLLVPSLEAVWLLTKIGAQTGRARFFDLRKIPVERLRSLRGIAHVIHDALHLKLVSA